MDSSWVLGAHNLEINKNKDLLHRNHILVGRTNVYPSNSNIRQDLKMLRMLEFTGKTREGAKFLPGVPEGEEKKKNGKRMEFSLDMNV